MACDGCNCYFSLWAVFCTFFPLTAQKIKIYKKMKKTPASWDMVCPDGQMGRHKDRKSDIEVGAPYKNE